MTKRANRRRAEARDAAFDRYVASLLEGERDAARWEADNNEAHTLRVAALCAGAFLVGVFAFAAYDELVRVHDSVPAPARDKHPWTTAH